MSKQHRFTSRTKARKRAADVVYEADQRGMGSNPDVLRDLLRERRVITAAQTPLPEFSIQIIAGVADNLRRIDSLISAHARVPGWIVSPPWTWPSCAWPCGRCSRTTRCRRSSSSTRPFRSCVPSRPIRRPLRQRCAGRDPQSLESPAWSRRQGSEGETSVVDSDHDEAVAESAHDGESLPVQEAPVRSLPAGAKPLDGGSVEDELDELLEEY